jgi:tetratricopeptide (TPR) repeat protein
MSSFPRSLSLPNQHKTEEIDMRKLLALTVFMAVALASNVFGAEAARISGKILDAQTKQPIANATITLDAVEGKTFHSEYKAKKDGSYAVMVMTGTIRYKFVYAAPGYQPYEETMKLKMGEPNLKDVALIPGNAAAPATAGATTAVVPAGEIKADPGITAFNEGAALANAGRNAEALVKFEEAVAAKPEMAAAWSAIARKSLAVKKYDRAITAANKLLEIDPDETAMYGVLAEAYTATGDKAKAAEMKKKLPADANALFNEAVPLLNGGKFKEAIPLLERALEADPSYARAHYHLGIAMMSANPAAAKQHFTKYLELEPKGSDADVAREALKGLN